MACWILSACKFLNVCATNSLCFFWQLIALCWFSENRQNMFSHNFRSSTIWQLVGVISSYSRHTLTETRVSLTSSLQYLHKHTDAHKQNA
ncbi:unnamed protein product [Schistosoma turkestanicum]|nr:unnamed protein product [Schistosoma turkestanicum]